MTVTELERMIKKWSGLKVIQETQQEGVGTWASKRVRKAETERNPSNTQVPGKSPEI